MKKTARPLAALRSLAPLATLVTLSFSASLQAADLLQVYREAVANDATFAAARDTLAAGQEKTAQGLSGLLPNVALTGNSTWNDNQYTVRSTAVATNKTFNSNGYALTLSQPLFRWQNWVGYDQAKLQATQAEVGFAQARQDLLLRTAQAYFDVLYAQENLRALRANKAAITQQLEAAKKNFEVGTTTITDTHEAQARFDLAVAQEIAAESDLEVKQRTLQAIIGKEAGQLAPVRKDARLSPPQPAQMTTWVDAATDGSLSVQQQRLAADIAEREVERQQAGHYPTVDLVANKGINNTYASAAIGMMETDYKNVGVQVSIPLFQGGATASKTREAIANRGAAQSTLEATRRNAALSARQYFLGVTNGLAQVRALEAAVTSS